MTTKKDATEPEEAVTPEAEEARDTEEAAEAQPRELTDAELKALCRERLCPGCDIGAEAEDIRLRSLAELDNTRKRLEKDKDEFRKYAAEKVLGALLPVLDNLDLALMHTPDEPACKNFALGVDMTRKAFLDVLAANGMAPLGEENEAFTPERHEAVGQDERDDMDEGIVTRVMQRGYLLNGRLLRPAKVMVSVRPK